ncbi:MAG TPA: TetR/AcrR family transcriptional regulator [Baekduia sp.]|nr:TetR/AcrR family transcriptional regulator [Baekduia sp.]
MAAEPATGRTGNARGRASRLRLLEAAARCFGDRGYQATRIADITAAAGMSQGGFYRHFRDKDEILVEALREPLDALLRTTAVDAAAPVDEAAIIAGNTSFFAVYAEHRRLFRVLREAAALHEPGLTEIWLDVRSSYVDRIEAWLRRLEAAGELRTGDVRVLAEALGAVLDQMAYTRFGLAERDPDDDEIALLGRVSGELWFRALRG